MHGQIESSDLHTREWFAGHRAQVRGAPTQTCGKLNFAAILYLSLPLFVFFAGFTRVAIAVPALVALVAALYRVRPSTKSAALPTLSEWFLCAAISGLFLLSCAYLAPLGRPGDWVKHFAIINELSQHAWPPVNETAQTFLRYYLAYYLIPGLLAGLFGDYVIDAVVLTQTWIGLTLILALMLQKIRPTQPAMFFTLFLLFSGLDLIGWLFLGSDRSVFSHKEWWAASFPVFAYEGNATLFLWVPQHALGSMIGVLLLVPNGRQSIPPQSLGLLVCSVLLWSPFAALGLLPFALTFAVRAGREAFLDWGNILCGLLLGVPLLIYLLAGAGDVPHGFNWNHPGFSFSRLAIFLILEVGLYLIALWFCGWAHLRYPIIVMAILILLPLYRIGVYNDFTMRACIPAITLLAIASAASLTNNRSRRCIPLAVLMVIGSITSVLEIIGRGLEDRVSPREQSLQGFLAEPPFGVQYFAPLPNWILRRRSE